ncbi:MAG: phosphopantetheine-binding protein [Acidobacteriota bacterium]
MTKPELLEKIRIIIERTAAEKGLTVPPIDEETVLLGSSLGIDSLDLAAIVVELSEATGKDPFQDGFVDFRTVGELRDLYSHQNGE